jgi:hypothetical protein
MKALFQALCSIRAFISFCDKWVGWIQTQVMLYREAQLKKKIEQAIVLSSELKDTSKIDEAFRGK